MAESGLLETRLEDGVFNITLTRPEKRNALSIDMLNAIFSALDAADENRESRVIVISAEGPVFSSGHDLKELTAARNNPDRGRDFFDQTMRLCSSVMQKIVNHRLPVIAKVQGSASAAGCQLVATCDLAVASDDAKFITPGVNIGLFCSTPMVALSRNVANKHSLEMLLTGEPCPAQKAVEIGLINKAVPVSRVDETVKWYTDRIMAKSLMTVKTGKQAFYNQVHMPLAEAYDYCAQVMVENMLKHDAEEGINAFLEKRQAEWKDE
ncbi:MAG: enoyl-CoA hydratase [Pseudomonadota bacterium]